MLNRCREVTSRWTNADFRPDKKSPQSSENIAATLFPYRSNKIRDRNRSGNTIVADKGNLARRPNGVSYRALPIRKKKQATGNDADVGTPANRLFATDRDTGFKIKLCIFPGIRSVRHDKHLDTILQRMEKTLQLTALTLNLRLSLLFAWPYTY